MEDFRFENTLTMTESLYLSVWAIVPTRGRVPKIRLAALTAAGIALLFTPYMWLVGLIVLGVVVLFIVSPAILSFGTRSTFRGHKYLRDALIYGVSDQKLWVRGARMDASVSWSMLVTWREIEGMLVLSPSGIPPVYLSLARLREAGLYGRVRALAASNAPEFNTSRRAHD